MVQYTKHNFVFPSVTSPLYWVRAGKGPTDVDDALTSAR